jgi:RimJ/RimL family protein N-acetyltransferase
MEHERKIGTALPGWTPPPAPDALTLEGQYARLERLDPAPHGEDLFAAYSVDKRVWDYLPYGPFDDVSGYQAWVSSAADQSDPWFYAIIDKATGRAGGVASYLRITPASGSIEVGHINLAPVLQGSRVATEALFLMMKWAFDAGYRRYEWKCDALNLPSRRAAERLGFSYEGVFRQATVYKGRNRDTAWFAVIDQDWPAVREAYRQWLDRGNFDADGRQRKSLSQLTHPLLVMHDPAF